jgi:uncharacterized lipoprotein
MDVDKKLGMSLEDLIKKTRKDVPKKVQAGPPKTTKLGVRRSLGKKGEKNAVRSTGKTGATVTKRVRRRLISTSKDVDMEQKARRTQSKSELGKKSFSRTVVIKKGPNAPGDERRKVKITNVPYDLTWKDVKVALGDVGKIERCDVERGNAVVTFSTHKEASRAIQTYNNGDMNGRKIRVFFE